MTDQVSKTEVEDVLSSIRRLVGETKQPDRSVAGKPSAERLVLTPQLRVSDQEVLRLMPEDAVALPTRDWQEYEEPPLQDTQAAPLIPRPESVRRHEAKLLQASDVSELTAKIAALETAIAKTADQWEPDGAGRDAYAGTPAQAMTWHDNVDLDATGSPVTQNAARPVQETATEEVLENAVEDQIIDEVALRALVAEIVRSELQGELGERITRNVRKLVRREIHRALAAQSLD